MNFSSRIVYIYELSCFCLKTQNSKRKDRINKYENEFLKTFLLITFLFNFCFLFWN